MGGDGKHPLHLVKAFPVKAFLINALFIIISCRFARMLLTGGSVVAQILPTNKYETMRGTRQKGMHG